MCQPPRAPKSPADRQAEANAALERIAAAAYAAFVETFPWELPDWPDQDPHLMDMYRHMVRRLLIDGVIAVGRTPSVERPMAGQTSLYDD